MKALVSSLQSMNGRYPVQIVRNVNIYTGEWRGVEENGRGKCGYSSGVIYDENCKDDNYNGRGKLTFPSGALHDGYFTDDLPDERGWYIDEHGSVSDGNR